jgi:Cu-Zn family superoxide dismutase
MLQPSGPGVQITGTISGLTPGSTHGFHIHENGDCSAPDASSAGEHYNPSGQPHGDPATENRHLGDMPNITADDQGVAQLTATIGGLSLRTGQANDIVGRSIVIHEKADDYKTQPSGNSGKRIACAIIK